jgi:uncharacterized membrane protein YgcG
MVSRLLCALALVLCLPGTANAQFQFTEHIERYDVDVTIQRSGRMHVVETIDYVFVAPRHGLLRKLRVAFRHDDRFDRVYPVSDVHVTGSRDTPLDTKLENDGAYRVVRVGDPDETITGQHRYVLTYDVDGAINRFEGHDELYWNVVGPDWDVPIVRSTVTVHAEAAISAATCAAGVVGTALPCRSASFEGRTATFAHGVLGPRAAMTFAVALPGLYAAKPGPLLRERWSLRRAFAVNDTTVPTATAVLAIGLVAIAALLWGRSRDLVYSGQVPGLEPAGGAEGTTRRAPVLGDRAGPVEWSPEDMPPGLMGLVLDEEVHTLDVTATIVDLAARGHLVIEELPRRGLFRRRDWRLSRIDPPEGERLTSWESETMRGLFHLGSNVRLSDLKNTFHPYLTKVRLGLYDDAMRRGWFTRRPDEVRGLWFGLGVSAVVAGGAATYVLAQWTTFGIVGLAFVLLGLVLLSVHRRMPFRTAKGSAALARALGFKRYLATAEADQLRDEEKAGVFARYLPYAIVLGETERWAKVFKDLGLPPQQHVSWYAGPSGWSFDDFNDSMDAFSSSAASTVTSTPGSSGGSGFSGGGASSGGGGGGGGGGSW